MQLNEALSRRNDYAEACRELRCILRAVYVYAPISFQALLYEDVEHAFHTLSKKEKRMDDIRHLETAKLLLQTVEQIFSSQNCTEVVAKGKTATKTWHRLYNNRNPEPLPEYLHLSGDILLHVFEYLDARSLATASAVCRAWNVIATDGKIWRNWFLYVYGTSNLREDLMTAAEIREDIIPDSNRPTILKKPSNNAVGYWRKAFNLCSKGRSPHLSTLNRAYCPTCKEVIWLRDPPWKPAKGLCVTREQVLEYHSPRPISVSQVVRFVVSMARVSDSCSRDSDDDDDHNLENSFLEL